MKKIIELCVYAAILLAAILFSVFGGKPARIAPTDPDPPAAQESSAYSYAEPQRQALEGY